MMQDTKKYFRSDFKAWFWYIAPEIEKLGLQGPYTQQYWLVLQHVTEKDIAEFSRLEQQCYGGGQKTFEEKSLSWENIFVNREKNPSSSQTYRE